jgi:hypothetical protein
MTNQTQLMVWTVGLFAFAAGAIFGVISYESVSSVVGSATSGTVVFGDAGGASSANDGANGVELRLRAQLADSENQRVVLAAQLAAKGGGTSTAAALVASLPTTAAAVQHPDSVGWDWNLAQNSMLLQIDGGDADTYSSMVGDARLRIAEGPSEAWDAFVLKSTEMAVKNPGKRALIICPKAIQEAGLGNALFAAAGIVALGARFNMLPVIPCRRNKQLGALGFKYMHCVDERAVPFAAISDGGGHFDMKYQSELEKRSKAIPPTNSLVRGYFQYYRGFGAARDAVCWALRPDLAAQQEAIDFLFEVAFGNKTDFMNEHTSIIAAHVRRGDYGGKNKMHGFLSEHYYNSAWKMLQAQVGLEDKLAGQNLVVLIFAMSNEMEWVKQHVANKFPGAKRVIVVDPFQRGRGSKADIDMLAMALASYYILPNSTFSWWSSFFSDCRRRLGEAWWSVKPRWKQRKLNRPLATLPHRWHVGRDVRFPETYQYMQSRYLIPGLFPLYEGEEKLDLNKKRGSNAPPPSVVPLVPDDGAKDDGCKC